MRSRFGCLFLFVCLFVTVLARVPACRIVVVVIDTAHIFFYFLLVSMLMLFPLLFEFYPNDDN